MGKKGKSGCGRVSIFKRKKRSSCKRGEKKPEANPVTKSESGG